ncbi:hypothetical protein [Rubrivivax gelatinosus]|uniref:hypothetical protein n=1 Tax=Rubrivivax gelatinosus TaxID=28068 RepID=UPI0012FE44FA|nr:hypothetical protein [Rubrivivax gelatinosus]MBG6083162.1 hypothetical protein [Rubrivivax gelatinosus]
MNTSHVLYFVPTQEYQAGSTIVYLAGGRHLPVLETPEDISGSLPGQYARLRVWESATGSVWDGWQTYVVLDQVRALIPYLPYQQLAVEFMDGSTLNVKLDAQAQQLLAQLGA